MDRQRLRKRGGVRSCSGRLSDVIGRRARWWAGATAHSARCAASRGAGAGNWTGARGARGRRVGFAPRRGRAWKRRSTACRRRQCVQDLSARWRTRRTSSAARSARGRARTNQLQRRCSRRRSATNAPHTDLAVLRASTRPAGGTRGHAGRGWRRGEAQVTALEDAHRMAGHWQAQATRWQNEATVKEQQLDVLTEQLSHARAVVAGARGRNSARTGATSGVCLARWPHPPDPLPGARSGLNRG